MVASTRASASSWVSPAALSCLADTTRECCRQVRPAGCWTGAGQDNSGGGCPALGRCSARDRYFWAELTAGCQPVDLVGPEEASRRRIGQRLRERHHATAGLPRAGSAREANGASLQRRRRKRAGGCGAGVHGDGVCGAAVRQVLAAARAKRSTTARSDRGVTRTAWRSRAAAVKATPPSRSASTGGGAHAATDRAPNMRRLSGGMRSATPRTILKMDRPIRSSETASSPILRERRTASKP